MAAAVLVPLALTQTPGHDDSYTLEYARQPTLGAVLDLHADTRNSTPVPPYVFFWAVGQVIGSSFAALSLFSVAAWVVFTLALGQLLRGLAPLAVFVGALAPTLSSLAYLGFAVRSYAVALALLAWATVLVERARRGPAPGRATIGAALLAFLACVLHYPAALYVGFLALWSLGRRGGPRLEWRLPAALAVAVVGASGPQLGQASAAAAYGADLGPAGTSWGSGLLTQLSLARTWWPLLVVLAVLVATPGRRRSARTPMPEAEHRPWPSTPACVVVALALPALAALPFALAGAEFHHRYAAPALVASSVLVGRSIEAGDPLRRGAMFLLGPAVLLSLTLSVQAMVELSPSRRDARAFQAALGLEASPLGAVYVADQRAFLVLRELGPSERRWMLTTGQPTPIGRRERAAMPTSGPRIVVAQVGPDWDRLRDEADEVEVLGRAELAYSGRTVRYVAAVLR